MKSSRMTKTIFRFFCKRQRASKLVVKLAVFVFIVYVICPAFPSSTKPGLHGRTRGDHAAKDADIALSISCQNGDSQHLTPPNRQLAWDFGISLEAERDPAATYSAFTVPTQVQTTSDPADLTTQDESIFYEPCPEYNFIINPRHVCSRKQLVLLMLIITSPENRERRMMIRQTWGNHNFSSTPTVQKVFVTGRPNTTTLQNALEYESDLYQDILQADFGESYYNLTHKTIMALQWVTHFCRSTVFVLKVDDDVFINVFRLLPLVKYMNMTAENKNILMCQVNMKAKVYRTGKYKVSEEEYAGDYYPPFCLGPAYLMSLDVAERLFFSSKSTAAFKLEDVYTTGFLAAKVGIRHRQFGHAYVVGGEHYHKLKYAFSRKGYRVFVFSHFKSLRLGNVLKVWNQLVTIYSQQHSKSKKLSERQDLAIELGLQADRNAEITFLLDYDSYASFDGTRRRPKNPMMAAKRDPTIWILSYLFALLFITVLCCVMFSFYIV